MEGVVSIPDLDDENQSSDDKNGVDSRYLLIKVEGVVVNFLSQVGLVFLLFLGMVMYANDV